MMSSLQHNLLREIMKRTLIILLQQCARLLLHLVLTTILLIAIKPVCIRLMHCLNLAHNVFVQVATVLPQVLLQFHRAMSNLLRVVKFPYLYFVLNF